jgi:DNA-binding transcriptional ArsR family regulator
VDTKKYSKYFKAIGDPSRLKIIALISSKELTVNEIAEHIGLSQPTISRHLAILRDAEIVIDRRDKQSIYYKLNKNSVENCCSGFCECVAIPVKKTKKKKK